LLFGLSAASLAVIIERAVALLRMRARAETVRERLVTRLREGNVKAAKQLLSGTRAAAARVAQRGLDEVETGATQEGIREAMAAQTLVERRQLEKGFVLLSTLGANAPFIGLFGTVVGVLQAFDALGSATNTASALAPQAVMGSIAEALVATAVGLGVAIPAVMAFNVFQRMVRSLTEDAEILSHEVLSFASRRPAAPALTLAPRADEAAPRSSRNRPSSHQVAVHPISA
jgi:biopolymer transport protein ExbB